MTFTSTESSTSNSPFAETAVNTALGKCRKYFTPFKHSSLN